MGKKYDIKGGEINSLCCLSTNEILVGGLVDSINDLYFYQKAYLAKLSSTGKIKWERSYLPDKSNQLWYVNAIIEKNKSYNLTIISNNSFHILEVDSLGLTKWDTELDGYCYGHDHLLYTNNGYIVLYDNIDDIKISCLNESGEVNWTHSYGGTGYETASSIHILSSSDLFITGSSQNYDGIRYDPSNSDYFIRTDNNGNICY
jgi:hypothetical protein